MIRWGIIGTGDVAYDVAYAILFVAGNKITAIASRNERRAQEFAANIGATKIYTSAEALIGDKEIDAVYIAVPNHLHFELMKKSLLAGKHVLCEKPFTLNATQAEAIRQLAATVGCFCMEAMWTRFIPAIGKARELIQSGELGQIRFIHGSFGTPVSKQSRHDPKQGGGALLDLGVYPVSLAHLFMGKPATVQAEMQTGNTGVDEQSVLSLHYDNGALAALMCSFQTVLSNEMVIYGEKGTLKIGPPLYRTARLRITKFAHAHQHHSVRRNIYKLPLFMRFAPFIKEVLLSLQGKRVKHRVIPFEGNGYHYQIQEVTACIENGKIESNIMPLKHSVEVMQILDEARKKCGLKYPEE
ncbi:MAG: putative oxidoreductase [Chitinophagales bacterium]|nr:MAG: putative oxidoreductase [Chitinophagales bacterium]